MSLRRSATPTFLQLPRELSDILMRNGMQATLTMDAAGQPKLMVQGHDSPVLSYNLTHQQLTALTGWGSTYLNKQSYNTFADIVKDDFDLPRNYVHARNANTRVAMGLHGYRIGVGEYGRQPMMTPRQAFIYGMPIGFGGHHPHHGMGMGGPMMHQRGFWQVLTPFLGWTDRRQDGFHLRRMGGMLVTPQGAPIVPDRPDGRMKPGELQSGGYGFYWKGGSMNMAPGAQRPMEVDPLGPFRPVSPERQQQPEQSADMSQTPPRSQEPAKPYKELITSDVYFTSEKFKECLDSHGLILDPEKNELIVQSSALQVDLTYSLTKEDMDVLMSNSIKDHPVADRLAVLNNVLKEDFKDSLTMDMLNSNERIPIDLNDVAKAELAEVTEIHQEETARLTEQVAVVQNVREAIQADGMVIPLVSEKDGYHWQQDVNHDRDVIVGNVVAYENEGKAYLRADLNGEAFVKEISAKEFQEIQYRNDDRRLELLDEHLDGIRLEKGDYKGEVVNSTVTNGEALMDATQGNKGWYREGRDGREVVVGDISVEKQGNKFIMSAQIDGQTISHEISQKDFNKFVQMDDFHRMKLFARIFDEVDIKNNVALGTRVGAAVAATLTVLGGMAMDADPMVSMPRGEGMPHGMGGRAYFKPGVDSPMDIAARNFEAAMITDQIQHGLHH